MGYNTQDRGYCDCGHHRCEHGPTSGDVEHLLDVWGACRVQGCDCQRYDFASNLSPRLNDEPPPVAGPADAPPTDRNDPRLHEPLKWDAIAGIKAGMPMTDVVRHRLCSMAQDRACQLEGSNPTHRESISGPADAVKPREELEGALFRLANDLEGFPPSSKRDLDAVASLARASVEAQEDRRLTLELIEECERCDGTCVTKAREVRDAFRAKSSGQRSPNGEIK